LHWMLYLWHNMEFQCGVIGVSDGYRQPAKIWAARKDIGGQ